MPRFIPEERRTGPHHSQDVRRAAVNRYLDEEMTTPEVAAMFGVRPATIRRWAQEAGAGPKPGRVRGYPPSVRKAALDAYRAGDSCVVIGQRLGINTQSVLNWVNAEGLPRRPSGVGCSVCAHPERDAVDRLVLTGEPFASVAEWAKIRGPTLRRHARLHLGMEQTFRDPRYWCAVCNLPLEQLLEVDDLLRPKRPPLRPSAKAVAERLGLALATVQTHQRRHLDNIEYQRALATDAIRRLDAARRYL